MKIKSKILAGFMLLIFMLLIAGAMSIYEFSRIGNSVKALIDNNYKTIEASKTMIEALEREDSGILLLISGQWKKGRTILESADSSFIEAFEKAQNNLTEENEEEHINQIRESYARYKAKWELPIVGTHKENSMEWYLNEVHDHFLQVKFEVEKLMNLNQESMYKEASSLKQQSHRALMPGIIAIVSALVFLILFNFFIRRIFVRPIQKITESVKNFHQSSEGLKSDITYHDEFEVLENEIQQLIQRLRTKNEN